MCPSPTKYVPLFLQPAICGVAGQQLCPQMLAPCTGAPAADWQVLMLSTCYVPPAELPLLCGAERLHTLVLRVRDLDLWLQAHTAQEALQVGQRLQTSTQ